MTYIPTIGLEIHAELKTKSKMFCSCANDFLETRPNVNICPVCMGHPGTLPTANQEAIRMVIKTGLALKCTIPEKSKFDRKNYFYPDLPKGYQISQYDMPIARQGELKVPILNSQFPKTVRITRVHLEEDTGKLMHLKDAVSNSVEDGASHSLVDFNRAGVPLMELVTEPDIANAKEASAFAQQLQLILRYLGVSDADMEKGQMRVEANISVKPEGTEKLGTKVEVKNLNSFKAVEGAIEFETKRQTEVLESGGKIIQETRGWNENTGETFSQREKEEAHDYRYFPEPDLPPLNFTQNFIQQIKAELPELPQERAKRFAGEYKLSEQEIGIFVENKDLGEYFEQVTSELGKNFSDNLSMNEAEKLQKQTKLAANYILSDLIGLLRGASLINEMGSMREASIRDEEFFITPENFAGLVQLIDEGTISSAIAKTVLREMFSSGKDPSQIIDNRGLAQMSNAEELTLMIQKVIAENPQVAADYKKGKKNALQFLTGRVMAETKGKANPQLVQGLLAQALNKK